MDISPVSNVDPQNFLDPTVARVTKQTLDSDDFLKLLTTQLTNQDPSKPVDDTAFMAQMASFSQLDQMKQLSTNIATFTTQQGIASAAQYLGKTVTVAPANSTSTTGVVTGVTIVDGKPQLTINGKPFDAADLTAVTNTAAATTTAPTTATSTAPTTPVTQP